MKTNYTFITVEQLLIILLRTPSNCKLVPMALIYNSTSPYGQLHKMVSEFFIKKKAKTCFLLMFKLRRLTEILNILQKEWKNPFLL